MKRPAAARIERRLKWTTGAGRPARRWLIVVLSSCWLVALVPLTSSACAAPGLRISSSQRLGRSGFEIGAPALDTAPDGRMAVAWVHHGVRVAQAPPGGRFGKALRVAAHSVVGEPAVAIDDRGDMVVAWAYSDRSVVPSPEERGAGECCDHIRVAMIDRGGRVRARQTLTPDNVSATLGDVAISSRGATVAVSYHWVSKAEATGTAYRRRQELSHLFASVAPFGRRFRARVRLGSQKESLTLRAFARHAAVAYSNEAPPREKEAVISRHGRLLSIRGIGDVVLPPSEAGESGSSYFASRLDASGGAAVLYEGLNYRKPRRESIDLMARRRGGRFHMRTLETVRGLEMEAFCYPSLGASPSGWLLAAWVPCHGRRVRLAFGEIGRGALPREVPGPPPLPRRYGVVGLAAAPGPRGAGVVVVAAESSSGRGMLFVRERTASGEFGPPARLALSGSVLFETEPQIAIDARGEGAIVWCNGAGRLFAARLELG